MHRDIHGLSFGVSPHLVVVVWFEIGGLSVMMS